MSWHAQDTTNRVNEIERWLDGLSRNERARAMALSAERMSRPGEDAEGFLSSLENVRDFERGRVYGGAPDVRMATV